MPHRSEGGAGAVDLTGVDLEGCVNPWFSDTVLLIPPISSPAYPWSWRGTSVYARLPSLKVLLSFD
jgi:hypothetical protein